MPGPGAAGVGAAAAAYKDKHEQVLRIAASDVAAVAGYHDWVDVRDLFLERLLYQVCTYVDTWNGRHRYCMSVADVSVLKYSCLWFFESAGQVTSNL